jgi:hypothetical protein
MSNFERITSSGTCSVEAKNETKENSVGQAAGENT